MRRLGGLIMLLLVLALPGAAAASPFANWTAVVVAGDWHSHDGEATEGFDNARRDVSLSLQKAGFQAAHIRQLSVRPQRYRQPGLGKTSVDAIYDALVDGLKTAPGGCLIYFSSHGAPDGVLVDDKILTPGVLGAILDTSCEDRPTVVVISACFSGVFVPTLAASNRMVLTAARPDRTSFGCSQADKYPYFDECFLKSIGMSRDFPALARTVQACVAARELTEGMEPPSEPQLFVGGGLRPLLPLYSLDQPAAPP